MTQVQAGLVLHGGGSGREFRAYDARTGEKLRSTKAQTGVFAGAISYELAVAEKHPGLEAG